MEFLNRDLERIWSDIQESAADCFRRMQKEEIKPVHVEEVGLSVVAIMFMVFTFSNVSSTVYAEQSQYQVAAVSSALTTSSGLTETQVQAILSLLRSFNADESVISNVNAALTGRTTTSVSPTAWCYTFSQDLSVGTSGNGVYNLVLALNKELLLSGKTDSFDEEVAAAVVQFQARYGIRQTGYVGPLTRAKLNSLYGCASGYIPPVETIKIPVSSYPVPVTPPTDSSSYSGTQVVSIIWGPGINPANGHKYYLTSHADWNSIEAKAQSMGGHLVSINDAAENEYVVNTFMNSGGIQRSIWIGLNDRSSEGNWVWTSGEPVTYTKWAPGEPNSGAGIYSQEDAVAIWSPNDTRWPLGSWNDGQEHLTIEGVIEVGGTTSEPPAPVTVTEQVKCVFSGATTDQSCRSTDGNGFGCTGTGTCVAEVKGTRGTQITWKNTCGDTKLPNTTVDGQMEYVNFTCPAPVQPPYTPPSSQVTVPIAGPITNPANGHKYYLMSAADWNSIEAKAVSMGGHLVAINDGLENEFIVKSFSNSGNIPRTLWIGLNDKASEGNWVWSTGEPVNYKNFAPGEPNNGMSVYAQEDVVTMWSPSYTSYPLGSWNDGQEHLTFEGVVEVVETTTTEPTTANPATPIQQPIP